MRKRRKTLIICQNSDKERAESVAKKLGINFLITTNLQDALHTIKLCGEKHLCGIIADFNFSLEDKSDQKQKDALAILAKADCFFLPSIVFINLNDLLLENDIVNLKKFSKNKKYPVLKLKGIDWEKAIYELNFYLSK